MSNVQLVWFKRDLRVSDHLPLSSAVKCGVVLPLYIVEPELWNQPDTSARQWEFCSDCLVELQANLALIGQSLIIRIGDPILILTELHNQFKFSNIWSHEETGNRFTYDRDLKVKKWCLQNLVFWNETPTAGVVRGLKNRSKWAQQWTERMRPQPISIPSKLTPLTSLASVPALISEALPSSTELNMRLDSCP
ncbi:deoxyribodipyrimidine photo-lyase, partial [Synechococcus sp. Cruz CV12-2-Slac-r]|uniref:deoxyribodipyrimidine photo-lyase n=1 Tax=Synechococcus sp. Cruz CV12-2-Slac-r TaxID=2823748 RepID=UPI0020CC48F6